MAKKFEIRNSTAEFLTFVAEGKEQGIQVLYKDETVWATQKAMAQLFDCSTDNIGLHLKNIYDTNELNKKATTEKISVVQQEGAREVRRNTLFYNLDAIISVGYRVNSIRATQFRQWCTYVIRQFSLRGYIIDKKRMENGSNEDFIKSLRIYTLQLLTTIRMHLAHVCSIKKFRIRCIMQCMGILRQNLS